MFTKCQTYIIFIDLYYCYIGNYISVHNTHSVVKTVLFMREHKY